MVRAPAPRQTTRATASTLQSQLDSVRHEKMHEIRMRVIPWFEELLQLVRSPPRMKGSFDERHWLNLMVH
jgi:hypothetical protein